MVAEFDLERERYNARGKPARDARGRLKAAREAGRLEARIRVLEETLGCPASSDDQLAQLSLAELQQQAQRLAEQFRQREN